MLGLLGRRNRAEGWFAASLGADAIRYAYTKPGGSGRPTIAAYGRHALGREKNALQKAGHDLHLSQYQCLTLLGHGEYQLLQVEAPNVPRAELKSAMRWRVKDLLDYHIDDATIDVLDVPPEDSAASRNHVMFAVCARNDIVHACIKSFQEARIPLSVIDVPETAQRNLGALFEETDRGVALAYFGDDWGLLTISFHGELFLARKLDLGWKQMSAADENGRKALFERVSLELQRTLDHFERQFHHVTVSKVLLAPLPEDLGLAKFLSANITLPVESIDLASRLSFEGPAPGAALQWQLFHQIGASLRHEGKAL